MRTKHERLEAMLARIQRDRAPNRLPQIFYVGRTGTAVLHKATPELDAAMDILSDAGMLDDNRARLLGACIRDGRNPEHFARHLVKLGKAFNQGFNR